MTLSSEKYLDNRGFYIYPPKDGCDWDTAGDVVLHGILKLCGCGNPESAGALIRDGLQHIKDRGDRLGKLKRFSGKEYDQFSSWEEQDTLRVFKTHQIKLFFLYMIDNLDLIEHGGGIGGSWLSQLGEDVLHDLKLMELGESS